LWFESVGDHPKLGVPIQVLRCKEQFYEEQLGKKGVYEHGNPNELEG